MDSETSVTYKILHTTGDTGEKLTNAIDQRPHVAMSGSHTKAVGT